MDVKALNHVLQMVRDILESDKYLLKCNRKMKEYFYLDLEKGKLTDFELDHAIELTIKICKELFYNS